MKPNFLIIGAAKCATTTLWETFRRHPQIFMPEMKEPLFFSRDDMFALGWSWYEGLFSEGDGKVAIGEATTCYTKQMTFPNASQRIAKHLPDTKLIYIVRDPLERIESHWRHLLLRSHDVSFDECLRQPDVIDASCYWQQISAYRSYFPDERILVLFLEEFARDTDAGLKRCYEFLGVDPSLGGLDPSIDMNVGKGARVDGPLIRFVRKVPGLESLKRAAPALSRAMGEKLRRTMPAAGWPRHLRQQVIDQLADDTASFLRHYQKPADFWPLSTARGRAAPVATPSP